MTLGWESIVQRIVTESGLGTPIPFFVEKLIIYWILLMFSSLFMEVFYNLKYMLILIIPPLKEIT